MVVRLLLFLVFCVCAGHSLDVKIYGDTYRILMLSSTATIEFSQEDSSDVTVLWRHDDPPAKEDARRKKGIGFYVIYNVTQRDSGRYVLKNEFQEVLHTETLEVKAKKLNYHRKSGGDVRFDFSLEPKSCNIYFFPRDEPEKRDAGYALSRRGWLHGDMYSIDCRGIDLTSPCGISNRALEYSCTGRYEIRDNNEDLALTVFLEVEPPPAAEFNPSYIGYGIGAFVATFSCCCCLRRCCCGKSSDEKDDAETPDAEPAVYYHGNDAEPGHEFQQLSQPSETHYPAQPSHAPTEPLIHNPPPYYSQVRPENRDLVVAAAEQTYAPTVLVPSEAEPKFEMKGVTFPSALPLSSESSFSHVYNSDKLNFL